MGSRGAKPRTVRIWIGLLQWIILLVGVGILLLPLGSRDMETDFVAIRTIGAVGFCLGLTGRVLLRRTRRHPGEQPWRTLTWYYGITQGPLLLMLIVGLRVGTERTVGSCLVVVGSICAIHWVLWAVLRRLLRQRFWESRVADVTPVFD